MSGVLRASARLLSTRPSVHPYPFSKTALTPPPPTAPSLPALRTGRGLMEYLYKTLPSPEKQQLLQNLFSRRSRNTLLPGSIVTVVSEQAPTSFTGVLIAIRRRGPDTSFIVRNIISRTGVEMQFYPCSPGLKEIKVVRKPPMKRMRRAKLFYLRDSPEKMSMIAGVSKR